MHELINIQQLRHEVDNACTYTPSVLTYNITTEFRMDDCKPYQIERGGCIWLNAEGAVGEVEFIYPNTLQNSNSLVVGQNISGIPLFEVTASKYDNPFIQSFEEGFLIWLKKTTEIELLISHGKIGYLISNNKLCGMLAKNPQIIE
ncbi:hypothetical protein MNQ98_05640 [Paenibacillus sp. N3/727]|uniref:hypothetical protein n=1 Tax=Paenibacillus sp. N3/727 TaxID=2925845 RepID=UPI001F533CED|nr:hypothetical protein [Paenibacillus sp. N3/727]UNK19513.1 hypothetical protein MNQ98_05640 [Paenibacillus sp. N3/727]